CLAWESSLNTVLF
nr:immunoglobulin light chain junction region [Macaca mulatta]